MCLLKIKILHLSIVVWHILLKDILFPKVSNILQIIFFIPVDPEREEVINICSNETAPSLTRVYLTMKGGNETIISQVPSVCHCYIESHDTVTLRALDIRLLNYNTGKCDGTELQV